MSSAAVDSEPLDSPARLLTTAEAAEWLGVSKALIRKKCRNGTMPGALPRVSGAWRIRERDLLENLDDYRQAVQMLEDPEYLTIAEAAPLLRMSQSLVRRMCQEGSIPGVMPKILGEWRVEKAALLAYLASSATGTG